MATFLVDTFTNDTTANTNAFSLFNNDNVLVTAGGSLLATGGNSSGLFMDGGTNGATIQGTVYGTNDGIFAESSAADVINVSGDVFGENNGIELGGSGNDYITVDSTGLVQVVSSPGGGSGILADSTDATIDVLGEVSSSFVGIWAESGNTYATVDVAAGGSVSGYFGLIGDSSGSDTIDVNGSVAGLGGGAIGLASNTNSLLVGSTGSVDDDGGDGVSVFGTHSYITNRGTIGGSAGGVAIDATGGTVFLSNSGTISGNVDDSVTGMTLTNSGTIDGTVNLSGSDVVTNTGTISNGIGLGGDDTLDNTNGTIAGGLGLAFGVDVTNSGTISGGIVGGGGDHIDNTGTITGEISDANATSDTINNSGKIHGVIAIDAAFLTNSGTILGSMAFQTQSTFENSGTVTGNIFFDGTNDLVTNYGLIHGAVDLGGDDVLTNDGTIHGTLTTGAHDIINLGTGSVTGGIIGNAGYDTFDFSGSFGHYKISGFTTAGNHDILSFASDDFTSYSQLQSHMVQEGNNVVITLDSSDDIILLNTKLTNLLSHDFTFS
jgi:hypothetical protein